MHKTLEFFGEDKLIANKSCHYKSQLQDTMQIIYWCIFVSMLVVSNEHYNPYLHHNCDILSQKIKLYCLACWSELFK